MRYTASEKLEIIQLVQQSPLSVRRSLSKIGVSKSTFYAWLDRYHTGGLDALEDRKPKPQRIWNRIPDPVRQDIVEFALEEPELIHGKSQSPSQIVGVRSSRNPASIGS